MLKSFYLYLISAASLLLTLGHTSGVAQTSIVDSLHFSRVQVASGEDSLHVSFFYHLSADELKSSRALRLVPRYVSDGVEQILPEVLINGYSRARYYAREQAALSHEEFEAQRPAQVITQKRGKGIEVHYHTRLKRSTSEGGRLLVDAYWEDCCQSLPLATTLLYAEAPTMPVPPLPEVGFPALFEANVSFIRPMAEKVKMRQANLSVRINFLVGKHDLLPDYRQNAQELARVDSVLRPMTSNPDMYSFTNAYIRGYASPEASAASNLSLSQRRADVFKDYVVRRYNLNGLSHFPSTGMGEDWNGLKQALEAHPMARQQQVMNIIESVANEDERERRLKALAGGVPYRELLANYFPPLRRMEMGVGYTVRALKAEEAEVMIDGRPQDLSAAEFFEVARRRNSDQLIAAHREGYGKEYYLATEYFAQDSISYINASSAALIRGALSEAKVFLEKAGDTPYAYNNYGLYYWLSDDVERAESYFRKALTVDAIKDTARYNLRLFEAWKQKRNPSLQPQ